MTPPPKKKTLIMTGDVLGGSFNQLFQVLFPGPHSALSLGFSCLQRVLVLPWSRATGFALEKEAALAVTEDEVCSTQEMGIHKLRTPKPRAPTASAATELPSCQPRVSMKGDRRTSYKKALASV